MSQKIFATVNGSPISEADFNNAVQGYAMELHRKTMDHLSADELAAIQDLALEKLLGRELIYQEALSRGVLAAPADSQIGLPLSSVPTWRTTFTHQRKTCGRLSVGRSVAGTIYLVSVT